SAQAERPSEQPSLARRSRVEAASARPQPTRQPAESRRFDPTQAQPKRQSVAVAEPAESRRFDPTQAQPKRQSVAVAERSRGSRTTSSRRATRNPEAEASRAKVRPKTRPATRTDTRHLPEPDPRPRASVREPRPRVKPSRVSPCCKPSRTR
uniref:Uncharacterized protein n=1 Tax=Cucumis melo TaxID=3656 RepID=A0A9I9CCT5_CUCME